MTQVLNHPMANPVVQQMQVLSADSLTLKMPLVHPLPRSTVDLCQEITIVVIIVVIVVAS